ncbi:MAG TPA: hypothetical protein VNZ66_10985 [Aeromicrobium sp.]|nr:hypothetical protein [Aeromicrobium sp.]
MSQQLDTLTHAQIPNPTQNLIGSTNDRGEVKAMAIFERQPRVRAWDQMSEIDRAVLLEAVRQRRKIRQQQRRLRDELYGMRHYR